MDLETFIILICAVYLIIYMLVYEINWQWIGFKKLKKVLKKKGRK